MKKFDQLKNKVRAIKLNLFVLYLAYKDPRVPWYAKLFAVCVVAYAFSPIDLIPDFIPILGYLDDLVIVPLGITIALKMIPIVVLDECRIKAEEMRKNTKSKNWIAATAIIMIWVTSAFCLCIFANR
ncbi:YkvA family protein [Paenibacillus dokdonensis]|uniref:YkvA family protein n=1 Tax=Paenibacillus dokdonensis TaxID=2567944 RepID=UPI001FEC6CAC|nr:YkvA family protein [Paenibacillus dokdonensis]